MKRVSMITGGIFLFTGLFILFVYIAMWLWNWLMPMIFELPLITFWQTAGLIILSKILFSGFKPERRWHRDYQKRTWHQKFREKFRNDPEQVQQNFSGNSAKEVKSE